MNRFRETISLQTEMELQQQHPRGAGDTPSCQASGKGVPAAGLGGTGLESSAAKHFIPSHGALLPQTASVGSKGCQKGFNHFLLRLKKRLKSDAGEASSAPAYTREGPGYLWQSRLQRWAWTVSGRDFSLLD